MEYNEQFKDAKFQKGNLLRHHQTPKVSVSMSMVMNPILIRNNGIVISANRTDGWNTVLQKGDIPFAILHLKNVYPLLVRIFDGNNKQSLLRKATPADFQECRGGSVSVVASVTQLLNADGTSSWSVQPTKKIYKFQGKDKNLNLQYYTALRRPSTTEFPFLEPSMKSSLRCSPAISYTALSNAINPNRTVNSSTPNAQDLSACETIVDIETSESIQTSVAPKIETKKTCQWTEPVNTSRVGVFKQLVSALESEGNIPNYQTIQQFIKKYY